MVCVSVTLHGTMMIYVREFIAGLLTLVCRQKFWFKCAQLGKLLEFVNQNNRNTPFLWCILLVPRNFLYINWNNIAVVRANGDILMVNMVRTRECVRITRWIVTDCCSHYISLHNTNTCMHSRLWNSPVYLLHSECALMYGVYYFLWCHLT